MILNKLHPIIQSDGGKYVMLTLCDGIQVSGQYDTIEDALLAHNPYGNDVCLVKLVEFDPNEEADKDVQP